MHRLEATFRYRGCNPRSSIKRAKHGCAIAQGRTASCACTFHPDTKGRRPSLGRVENKATRFSWLDSFENVRQSHPRGTGLTMNPPPDYSSLLGCVRGSSEEIDRCFRVWRRDLSQKRSGFSRRLPERQLVDLTGWPKRKTSWSRRGYVMILSFLSGRPRFQFRSYTATWWSAKLGRRRVALAVCVSFERHDRRACRGSITRLRIEKVSERWVRRSLGHMSSRLGHTREGGGTARRVSGSSNATRGSTVLPLVTMRR